jgi:AcrR family transcriptional regulator
MKNLLGTEDPTDIAVFECIAMHGIENVTMDMVARRSQRSRAAFYREFSSWRRLLSRVHRRALRLMDWWFPRPEGQPRLELEWWWATMMEFFATSWGRAFLALRPQLATESGMNEVEFQELKMMPALAKWARAPEPIMRAIWAITLSAACPTVGDNERVVMREMVFSLIAPYAAGSSVSDDELGEFVALDALT